MCVLYCTMCIRCVPCSVCPLSVLSIVPLVSSHLVSSRRSLSKRRVAKDQSSLALFRTSVEYLRPSSIQVLFRATHGIYRLHTKLTTHPTVGIWSITVVSRNTYFNRLVPVRVRVRGRVRVQRFEFKQRRVRLAYTASLPDRLDITVFWSSFPFPFHGSFTPCSFQEIPMRTTIHNLYTSRLAKL